MTEPVMEAPFEERADIYKALAAFGDDSVPAFREALEKHATPKAQAELMMALLFVRTEEAARLQVEQAFENPHKGARGTAFSRLVNTIIPFPLRDDQLASLTRRLADEGVMTAGDVARALGHCVENDIEARVWPVLGRFEREVVDPSEIPRTGMSYLSPRVLMLNPFLLAFSYMGEDAAPYVRAEIEHAQDEVLRKWLFIGLGMTGDPSAAETVRAIIEQDPDRYVRCVAVRAYARSAGQAGLPYLETLLEDPTESEYGDCHPELGPMRLIAEVAADEISRLRKAAEAETALSAPPEEPVEAPK